MCNPLLFFGALGALSGAAQINQRQEAADAAVKSATLDSNMTQQQLNTQARQQESQASELATEQKIQLAEAISTQRASAGEAGVTGTGVNRVVGNVGAQGAKNLAVTERNLTQSLTQINTQKSATELQRASAVRAANASRPGGLETLLTIGGGAVQGYLGGQSMFGAGATFGSAADQVGSFFSNPETFMKAGAVTSLENAKRTGYSDEFESGALIRQQLR